MTGLRREEVALLAGVSIDYYVRMERGNLAGTSDAVLEGVARAHAAGRRRTRPPVRPRPRVRTPRLPRLRRKQPTGCHGRACSRSSTRSPTRWPGCATPATTCWPPTALARALYVLLLADPRLPANTARFIDLDPASRDYFTDWNRAADDIAAMLRL